MKAARVSYVGTADVEYTEIRPIRPNQSVVLAGLGVTGSKVGAWRKDRGYRSSQGAGYSDGLVIHSRPATQERGARAKTGGYRQETGRFSHEAEDYRHIETLKSMVSGQPRVLYDGLPPLPSSSPDLLYRAGSTESYSLSPTRSPNPGRSTAGTYDMMFEQHLQNIVNIDDHIRPVLTDRSTPGTGRYRETPTYREASCQTPTELDLRYFTSAWYV